MEWNVTYFGATKQNLEFHRSSQPLKGVDAILQILTSRLLFLKFLLKKTCALETGFSPLASHFQLNKELL